MIENFQQPVSEKFTGDAITDGLTCEGTTLVHVI